MSGPNAEILVLSTIDEPVRTLVGIILPHGFTATRPGASFRQTRHPEAWKSQGYLTATRAVAPRHPTTLVRQRPWLMTMESWIPTCCKSSPRGSGTTGERQWLKGAEMGKTSAACVWKSIYLRIWEPKRVHTTKVLARFEEGASYGRGWCSERKGVKISEERLSPRRP